MTPFFVCSNFPVIACHQVDPHGVPARSIARLDQDEGAERDKDYQQQIEFDAPQLSANAWHGLTPCGSVCTALEQL